MKQIPLMVALVLGLGACDGSTASPPPNQEKPGKSAKTAIPFDPYETPMLSGTYICIDNHVYYIISPHAVVPIFNTRSSQPDDAMECSK